LQEDEFNLALLVKWLSRLLIDRHSLWKNLLSAKYGANVVWDPDIAQNSKLNFAS
jgi:hypothetical protein